MNDTMKAAVLAAADATLTDWFKWAEAQNRPHGTPQNVSLASPGPPGVAQPSYFPTNQGIIMPNVKCHSCGKWFEVNYRQASEAKACSSKCRQQLYRDRKRYKDIAEFRKLFFSDVTPARADVTPSNDDVTDKATSSRAPEKPTLPTDRKGGRHER